MTNQKTRTLYQWVTYLNLGVIAFEQVKDDLYQMQVAEINARYDKLISENPMGGLRSVERRQELAAAKASYDNYEDINKSMVKAFETLDSNPIMKYAAAKVHKEFSEWFKLERANEDG